MSELKAFNTPRYAGEFTTNEVYLKSEADAYIADLEERHKEEVDELQKATDSAWGKVNAMYDEILHQKWKRCLAMAMWCKRKRIDAADYRIPRKKWEFYNKWYDRWLELAEHNNLQNENAR